MVKYTDIKGYEGEYIIDEYSNVVSLPKIQGRYLHNKYVVLTPKKNKYGYLEVALTKDGQTKTLLLHRLMAIAFIPNPNNLLVVNHKNGIKTDNRIENLEWCTKAENTQHAFKHNLGNFSNDALGRIMKYNALHSYYKVSISKDGKTYLFNSAKEASVFIGTTTDNITRAIRKKQRTKGWLVTGERLNVANGETLAVKDGRQSRGKS